jgi:motility quorum-sensing regulator/GCU-specific mRNA interferase toxin
MTEKRKPTYDLDAFKAAFSSVKRLAITGSALRSAAALGFVRNEIVTTIRSMRREHFYKSMTAYADQRLWQDVYHVPSPVGVLYVKFTALQRTPSRSSCCCRSRKSKEKKNE